MTKAENLWIITITTHPSGQYHLTKSARSHSTLCKIRTGLRNYERQQVSDFDSVETVGHWSGWCAACKAKLPKKEAK